MKSRVELFIVLVTGLAIGFAAGRLSDSDNQRGDILGADQAFRKLVDSATVNLPIYGLDHENWRRTIIGFLPISARLAVREQLQDLANNLSRMYFRGLPIGVTSVIDSGSLRIAKIELRDIDTNYSERWAGRYFQGSTVGGMTERTLVETFLQRDYAGEWVDGVEITYEGEYPGGRFDHVPNMYGVILRRSDQEY